MKQSSRYIIAFSIFIIGSIYAGFLGKNFYTHPVESNAYIHEGEVGFQYVVNSEHMIGNEKDSLRVINIGISKIDYNKENLDRIFLYFSEKYLGERERLQINITTDLDETAPKRFQENEDLDVKASFSREWYGKSIPQQFHEWYTYFPDLTNKEIKAKVILKGIDPYNKKRIIDNYETSNGSFKIRVECLDLMFPSSPPGYYYVFFSPKEHFDYWDAFMIYQKEQKVDIPRNNIRFINESIGYVFFGPIFAVTTDRGETWYLWNGNEKIKEEKIGESFLIKEVEINEFGAGKIIINREKTATPLIFYTNDYGKKWRPEVGTF